MKCATRGVRAWLAVMGFAGSVMAAMPVPARADEAAVGYYQNPAIRAETVVFVSEGDLWKVSSRGGVATRLTSHPGDENAPAISPDGSTVAFTARYEGPPEVYTMPIGGGLPQRLTFDGEGSTVVGWTPDGARVMYETAAHATLPEAMLATVDVKSGVRTLLPLSEASQGTFDDDGRTLYFTRLPFQGSHTKRYKGGTAQNLWKFAMDGSAEAGPLTPDYPGTSKDAMWWNGRVYFSSDRDGTMNIWSMDPSGGGLRQETRHDGFDIAAPSMDAGRIVYQCGADLWLLDLASGQDQALPITLESDFDQTRERWVTKPMDFLTAAHIGPKGESVVLTARGRVFVAPQKQGRFVSVNRAEGVRCRDAQFMPDGKTIFVLSDESGEVELWTMPANGIGDAVRLTTDGAVLRTDAAVSPDGKLMAHTDKNLRLWLYDIDKKTNVMIDASTYDALGQFAWSPDSKWLAYVAPAANQYSQVRLYHATDGAKSTVTSDRYDSSSPAWSADGKWLYLLSDRNLKSVVDSPWGSYAPEPFFDERTEIYQIALKADARSPFAPRDEVQDAKDEAEKKEKKEKDKAKGSEKKGEEAKSAKEGDAKGKGSKDDDDDDDDAKPVEVVIELDGLAERLIEVPIPAGNYSNLMVNDKALFWTTADRDDDEPKRNLMSAPIANENVEVKQVVGDIKGAEMSRDGKRLLVRKGDAMYIVDAAPGPADLDKKQVDLSAWSLSVIPREEWRHMYQEAWRLMRDYFYDTDMHGVDWKSVREKYAPLVDRVRSRAELSDVLAQMVSELSALHHFVVGGDRRGGQERVAVASFGAVLERDEAAGGYRVAHIYAADPDRTEIKSPLARQGANLKEGDVILKINGVALLSVPAYEPLLRNQSGRQVLLRVKPAPAAGKDAPSERDVIVTPISTGAAADLRYSEWEYTRRKLVDEWSGGKIGYVHLRAMGGENIAEWARDYYPVYNRQGLIIDVRHNEGGNIDSWILSRLLRKAWSYWNQRVGRSNVWNMQYAFRGHVAAVCDQFTASDGEAFSEGFKRLNIGRLFGMRTWGGEIWLSFSNYLADGGIASAAEYGVFGPEGQWLVEGHGVEPDVVVDNPPHATFKGEDAQLKAAVEYLMQKIKDEPVDLPPEPRHPDKSFRRTH